MYDNEVEEIETREVTAPPMVSANQSMMQVRSSFATAVHVQKPRNLREVEKEFLMEADLAGASFYYGWGVQDKSSGKNKAVEGPSIGLAKSLLRCWGNCAVEMLPVNETPQAYYFTAAFVDLEKGVTITRQFRQSKSWQVFGKMDAERKEDVRFQIGQSKAIRNVIRAALPDWMVQKGIEKAKNGEMQKLETYIAKNGIAAAQDYAIAELKKFGVTAEMILEKLERPTAIAITKEDIVLLKGDIQALRTGQDSIESLYPTKDASANGNGVTAKKATSLKEDLKSRAEKTAPDKSREIIAASGLDANEMMPDGFQFRYILGEKNDMIVDQQTGETFPLAQGVEKTEKVAQQAPGAAKTEENAQDEKPPYPPKWPEIRKVQKPKGIDNTWSDKVAITPKFLEKQIAQGVPEATYEKNYRSANGL